MVEYRLHKCFPYQQYCNDRFIKPTAITTALLIITEHTVHVTIKQPTVVGYNVDCIPIGGQKKRYKDNLKASLKELKINKESWEASATNRAKWHSKIFTGASAAETTRLAEAKHKRTVQKERSHSSTAAAAAAPTHECTICGRFFQAHIASSATQGLISEDLTAYNL